MYYDISTVRLAKTISLAAARRDRIDQLLAQFDAANYEVVGLHVESEAIARALLPQPLSKAPVSLIIDIGAARTSVCLVARGSIHFTVSYPSVLSSGSLQDQSLAGVARQALLYTQEHFGQHGAIEQFVLAGSGAAIPQIDQWLNQVVQLPVQIGNPLLHIKANHISKKLTVPAPFATAIGLALV
jgi:Tfp pilus assembly PilM family ATPase